MEFRCFAISDVGKIRHNNEDAYFVDEKKGIFMVADGIGGRRAGEVASSITKEIVSSKSEYLFKSNQIENTLKDIFFEANKTVRNIASTKQEYSGLGSTCALLFINQNNFYIAHVGDSRVYLYRKKTLQQLTRDHSYVEELFVRGLITEQEKVDHPYKHQITRYIGCSTKLEVDITSGPVYNNDFFLLCTDGLSDLIDNNQILQILTNEISPKDSVNLLLQKALEAGGNDNVTIIGVQVIAKKTNFFKKILG